MFRARLFVGTTPPSQADQRKAPPLLNSRDSSSAPLAAVPTDCSCCSDRLFVHWPAGRPAPVCLLSHQKAWNDLYHMGYRSDLTAGTGYGDEVFNFATAMNDAQRRALPILPELTRKALTWWVP